MSIQQHLTDSMKQMGAFDGRQIPQHAVQQMPMYSGKRTADPTEVPGKKKKKSRSDTRTRGLKHYSTCVSQKIQEKGVTTYLEVADELVQEQMSLSLSQGETGCEPKNIRRRVYDALNVLMAAQIISKDKKEIRWIGLPTNSEQEYKQYEDLKTKKLESIKKTKEQLMDLIVQQIAYHNLIKRNERAEHQGEDARQSMTKVQLPFVVINTDKETDVQCHMAQDRTEYLFRFNAPFEVHDDVSVLKRMGLDLGVENGTCTDQQLAEAQKILPTSLVPYLNEMVAEARKRRAAATTASTSMTPDTATDTATTTTTTTTATATSMPVS